MSCPKIFNQIESDTHQTLGGIKIQEIRERYFLGDEGKEIIDRILLRLKSSDLAENNEPVFNETVLSVFNQETDGYPEKETIQKIINTIAELFIFTKETLAAPERRLECLEV